MLLLAVAAPLGSPAWGQGAGAAPANAAESARQQKAPTAAIPRDAAEQTPDKRLGDPGTQSAEMNAGTVGVVSGLPTGSYLTLATDLASVLDAPEEGLRILPIVGKGAVQNVKDILFLKGVDLGFVRTDSMEAIRRDGNIKNAEAQIAYIARLMNDEMHLVTTRDITDIRQLAGKKVNFDLVGSGSYFTSTIVFERLKIPVEVTAFGQADAYEKLRNGEIAASIFWGSKPVRGFAEFKNDGRFHMLGVAYDSTLQDVYFPATLTNKDYPNLVGEGANLETVAVGTVLAAFNHRRGTERYKKVARFVDAFFGKFDNFLKAPRHPKWQEVNLAATIPGWRRFPAAEEWLERAAKTESSGLKTQFQKFVEDRERRSGLATASSDRERLFSDFLDWQRGRTR